VEDVEAGYARELRREEEQSAWKICIRFFFWP